MQGDRLENKKSCRVSHQTLESDEVRNSSLPRSAWAATPGKSVAARTTMFTFLGLLFTSLISFGFVSAGCSFTATKNSAVSVPVTRLYREAKSKFEHEDYAGALTKLDAIIASSALTPSDRSYYQHQQLICRAALTAKTTISAGISGTPLTSQTVAKSARHTTSSSGTFTADCGPRALLLACENLGVTPLPTIAQLRTGANTTDGGTTLEGLEHAARKIGLDATGVQMDRDALSRLSEMGVAWVDGNHFITVLAVNTSLAGETTAIIHDPNDEEEKSITIEDLLRRSGGVLLLLKKVPAASISPITSGRSGTLITAR